MTKDHGQSQNISVKLSRAAKGARKISLAIGRAAGDELRCGPLYLNEDFASATLCQTKLLWEMLALTAMVPQLHLCFLLATAAAF